MNDIGSEPPVAQTRPRRFSLIWLIPIVAAGVAGYLAWRTISREGPEITIIFRTGDGIVPGQTKLQHKAVPLGVVNSVRLSANMQQVIVQVQMQRDAEDRLTSHARFWVVRPRLSARTISGLETLVSGAYIEFDPGAPGGTPERHFTGLDEPPGIRSDEPGRTYVLKADRIGSLGQGSPVFYRDVPVGEVLAIEPPGPAGPVTLHIFVRAPYDQYVRQDTHFWNASGVLAQFGASGFHLQFESLQAVLSGGVGFSTPEGAANQPVAPQDASFTLYPDAAAAEAAGVANRVPFVTYFRNSVSGLAQGAPVQMFGIQIGTVSGVKLELDPHTGHGRVRVAFDVEPGRMFPASDVAGLDMLQVTRNFVKAGLRAQLQTANYVTGQLVLVLDFFAKAQPGEATQEDGAILVPSQPSELPNITKSLSEIVSKLNEVPLDQMVARLNDTLASIDRTVGSPELKQTLQSASAMMTNLQDLVRKADQNLTPSLQRLPEIAAGLQATVQRAERLMTAMNNSYGGNSDVARGLNRLLGQLDDTARSIRALADFLNRHPEALIRGRG